MNIKYISAIVLLTLSIHLSGQSIEFSLVNPAPRLGDEIEIKYNILDDSATVPDYGKLNALMSASMLQPVRKTLGTGTLKLTSLQMDTGLISIGPLSLTFNHKILKSDSLQIRLDAKLPNEKTGIWIRQVTFKGVEYLIIEQRIAGEWEVKKTRNSTTSTFDTDDEEYIEIMETETDNISFFGGYSYSASQSLPIDGEDITVGYKLSIYTINKKSSFKAPFKLDKSNLKNLSKKNKHFEFLVR